MTDDTELTLAKYIQSTRILSTRWETRAHWEAWAEPMGLLVRDNDDDLIDGPRVQHAYLNGPNGFQIAAPVYDENGAETEQGVYDPRWHVNTLIETGADPRIFHQFIAYLEANGEQMPAVEQNKGETGTKVAAIKGVALDSRTFNTPSHRFLC